MNWWEVDHPDREPFNLARDLIMTTAYHRAGCLGVACSLDWNDAIIISTLGQSIGPQTLVATIDTQECRASKDRMIAEIKRVVKILVPSPEFNDEIVVEWETPVL